MLKFILTAEEISVLKLDLKKSELYELTVRLVKDTRSAKANNFYYGVVIPKAQEGLSALISDETGIKHVSKNVAHYYLKKIFLTEHNVELGIDIVRRSSALNTEEFSIYIGHCLNFIVQKLGERFTETEMSGR